VGNSIFWGGGLRDRGVVDSSLILHEFIGAVLLLLRVHFEFLNLFCFLQREEGKREGFKQDGSTFHRLFSVPIFNSVMTC